MGEVVSRIIQDVKIPHMASVYQVFPRPKIEICEIPGTITALLEKPAFSSQVQPGMRIAITAGSRGVANVALITKTLVDFCKAKGASPFVVPAMGSHGGATAQGQLDVLHSYGITEAYLGCPIHSSMETVRIGYTEEGHEVHIDRHAAGADGIIVACRIKPHTCFRGEYESGMMKMMAIGLGKQYGADVCHTAGFGKMSHNVRLFGRAVMQNAPILFALASIENAFDETYRLEAVHAQDIEALEPDLLQDAFRHMPRILLDSCDLLIVDEIGKDYSGDGMDPNITGAFGSPFASGGINAQTIAVCRLSEKSHGNANGIGTASATTRRLFEKMDFDMTYPNAITARIMTTAKLPMVMANDKEAIQVCLKCCTGIDHDNPRVIRIANSLHLEHIQISEALLETAKSIPNLIIKGDPAPLYFDKDGNLPPFSGMLS